jgi:hypothetical protein
LDILWSSLFTVIACTFTIQHLNVPEQREGRDPTRRGDLKWLLKDLWRSLKWMLITILGPEILIARGASDFWVARGQHPRLEAFAEEDRVPWTFTHTLFANMGGFVIRSNKKDHEPDPAQSGEPGSSGVDSEQAASVTPTTTSNMLPNPFHLTASELINLRKSRHLTRLPSVTEDEINDRNKSNKFVKTLATIQIIWTIVQIVTRSTKRLAVAQLEIAVLAFAASAVIIYFLNWRKPKDVKTPYTLISYSGAIPNDIVTTLTRGRKHRKTMSTEMALARQGPRVGDPVPNDSVDADGDIPVLVSISIGCIIFSGIHIGAWRFQFPTMLELILWRVSSVWCTAWPATILLCAFVIVITIRCIAIKSRRDNYMDLTRDKFYKVMVFLYVIGRLILLVEVFRTILFLPPDAFVATWASNIPHIS